MEMLALPSAGKAELLPGLDESSEKFCEILWRECCRNQRASCPALPHFSPSVSSALPLGTSEFLFTMYLVKEGVGLGSRGCGWESTSWLLRCLWLCFLTGQPGQGSCEFCRGLTEGLMTELLAGP